MDQHRFSQVLTIEAASQPTHKHHREFQTLGTVDREDLYRVAAVGTALGILALFFQIAQPGHKTVQAELSAFAEGLGHGAEVQETLKPLFPVRHRRRERVEVQFLDHPVDQPGSVQIRRIVTKETQPGNKALRIAVI